MITAEALDKYVSPLVEREGGGPPHWQRDLLTYLQLLAEWNEKTNLVSRRTFPEVIERQLVPSLAVLPLFAPQSTDCVLDIGSGGGFPALPLKILRPGLSLDLIEAKRRKCEFLEEAVHRLELENLRVHWGRVESPPASILDRAPFDCATARAVGDHERLLRASAGLLGNDRPLWVYVDPTSSETEVVWEDFQGTPCTGLKALRTSSDG